MSWLFKKKVEPNFTINAQQELGYYIRSGHLLEQILEAKMAINEVRKEIEMKTTWVFRYAKKAVTYRWLIGEMMKGITETNSLIHQWVLPFIQPDKRDVKAKAVKGYSQIYIDTMNENYMLLQDLELKHYIQQKTLVFQRVVNNYALYFSISEFLNGISPDKPFVVPTKDSVYVLPPGMVPMNLEGNGLAETITGSGGRTSEDGLRERVRRPIPRKVPSRMENTID